MKILILGGSSGFIGSNLVNYFAGKHETIATFNANGGKKGENSKCTYLPADLTIKDSVNNLFSTVKPDVVINAAARTTGSKDVIERPFLHVTDNAMINSLVFEACHTNKVKHCLFFSCSVMFNPKESAQKESDWNPGQEIYSSYFGVGNMKVFSEKLCEFYSRLNVCKYTVVRLSNVFGPGDKFDFDKCHMMPALIRRVFEATDSLEIWGSGIACRDLIYIDDVVDLVERVIERQATKYELFNCGVGVARSINNVAQILKLATGKHKLKLIFDVSKPDIPTTVVLDTSKAKEILGWEAKTTFEDGISKTLSWYGLNRQSL